jgi:hypothetical protein
MSIEPVDPSKKVSGEGKEKYEPDLKRGPGKFDEVLEKAKVERAKAEIHEIAEKQRAKTEAERPRTYTERLQDMGRLPKPSGGGGGGGGGAMPKLNRDITKNMKKGGKVSSASKRADGCAIRGKTRI